MRYINIIYLAMTTAVLAACSTTSALEEDEQLFTGLEKIDYHNYEACAHQVVTEEELEAALATAPNGALFGSSYYRTPIPYGLWIWNSCSQSHGVFKKWLNKSFGKAPVLMSNVNPSLRSSVAKTVLANNGYFNGKVDYDVIEGKPERTRNDTVLRPRTAKVQYHVDFGKLFLIDSISYSNYPEEIYNRIRGTETLLKRGEPFSVSVLDQERTRIYNLLRNYGYYYYQPSYTSYLVDTLQVPGKVQMQLHFADSLSDDVTRKWLIGKTSVQIRRQSREVFTDTLQRRFLTIYFNGKKPPLRPRVILADLKKMRPGDLFSQDAYQESLNNLQAKGIFSSVDISFAPRHNADGTPLLVADSVGAKNGETRAGAGVLDMLVSATLDKPYDYTFQANAKGKTNSRLGPGVSIGLSKRNAFRGGELFSAEIGANYEFQTGGDVNVGNSYDFTADMSIQMPRLMLPSFINKKRRRWYTTPATTISFSGEMIRRAGFFNRNIISAELNYIVQPSATSIYQFSPIILTYGKTTDMTEAYAEKIMQTAYGAIAASDELVPKMRLKYIYTSPAEYRNPIFAELTFYEAGNITNLLAMAIGGKTWNQMGKKVLACEFSQFVKAEIDVRKTWNLGNKNSLVAHFFGGYMHCYGNSTVPPFSEMYFISGANDMRGFSMRSIGPGGVHFDDAKLGYTFHNGDIKTVFNIEYRPHLFGSLYGALFLDAGNIWSTNRELKGAYEGQIEGQSGNPKKIDLGVNIGGGIRYDLDFFVLRLDWGFAIHNPYDTGKSGFFNTRKFKNMQCINFAIGYPF